MPATLYYVLLAWGLTMAAYRVQTPLRDYWWTMLNCLFGAIILRTSACTINDIFDRKLDAGVGKCSPVCL